MLQLASYILAFNVRRFVNLYIAIAIAMTMLEIPYKQKY